MFAPTRGDKNKLRTLGSYLSNGLNLSQNILKRDKKSETRKFESLTLLEAGLGFGFSYPSGLIPKPEWRLNGSRAILLSIFSVSFHFGGGKL